jgi:DNA-binding CsgD family transcriptional regulator
MNREDNLISINRTSAFRLDPALTSEEAIILRALASGLTDREVCRNLRMDPNTFLRMMLNMREKIGAKDNVSLIEWAKERINNVDQRIDRPGRFARHA